MNVINFCVVAFWKNIIYTFIRMKKLKDQNILDYTIKIRLIREIEKVGKGEYNFKDKMYLVDILNSCGGGIGFNVKATPYKTGPNLRRVFKRIQEELHLK